MARRRSYDIGFADSALYDLAEAGDGARHLIEAIYRRGDEDVYSWGALEVPRGAEGAWVAFQLLGRWVIAQWNKGNPALWYASPGGDAGRGFLKLVRIVPPGEFAAVVDRLAQIENLGQ